MRVSCVGCSLIIATCVAIPVLAQKRIAIIGNSMPAAAIDTGKLNATLSSAQAYWNIASFDLTTGTQHTISLGVESAFEFCAVWNQSKAAKKPDYVLIVTRRARLTCPNVRIWGKDTTWNTTIKPPTYKVDSTTYRKDIVGAIGKDIALRAIVDSLAYNDSVRLLPTRLPLIGYKGNINSRESDSVGVGYDFAQAMPVSFLPRILGICQTKGIKVVVLIHKDRRYAFPNYEEPPAMTSYRTSFAAYMQRMGAHLVDYTLCAVIDSTWYKVSKPGSIDDHIDPLTGRAKYTALVAEDLNAILRGGRGPRELTNIATQTERMTIKTPARIGPTELQGQWWTLDGKVMRAVQGARSTEHLRVYCRGNNNRRGRY